MSSDCRTWTRILNAPNGRYDKLSLPYAQDPEKCHCAPVLATGGDEVTVAPDIHIFMIVMATAASGLFGDVR